MSSTSRHVHQMCKSTINCEYFGRFFPIWSVELARISWHECGAHANWGSSKDDLNSRPYKARHELKQPQNVEQTQINGQHFFSVSSTCSFLARRLDSIESIKSEKRITEQWLSRVNKSVGIFLLSFAEISVIRVSFLSRQIRAYPWQQKPTEKKWEFL